MTHRRGKATPKSIRAPARPLNAVKHQADIHAHHEKKAREKETLEQLFQQAAEGGAQERETHLAAFFALHRATGVEALVYDPSNDRTLAHARTIGPNACPTDFPKGPGYLVIDPQQHRKREWKYRVHRDRPVFVTGKAYTLTAEEFENFVVDRLYARARELHGTPLFASTPLDDGQGRRIPRDAMAKVSDRAYWLLADAHALVSQLHGAKQRGMDQSARYGIEKEIGHLERALEEEKTADTYVASLLQGALVAIRRVGNYDDTATRTTSPLPSVPQYTPGLNGQSLP
jgi:hypothetical protein